MVGMDFMREKNPVSIQEKKKAILKKRQTGLIPQGHGKMAGF